MDVGAWLKGLGLEDYAEAFAENGVEADLLPELTNEDLKDLGIARLADRKTILKAITALESTTAPPAEAPATAAESSRSHAERRQLTVMFVDLVGSTGLSHRLDPEDLHEVMRRYQDAVAGSVTRYEGYVAKFLGDGVLAYFGWPKAYEDQAERAVRAGLDAVTAVRDLKLHDGLTLQARVGIATGLVIIGDIVGEAAADVDAVVGETPNVAARLQASAAPDAVVIGAGTRELLGSQFAYRDLGLQTLKGIAEPLPAWQVTGLRAVETRFSATHTERLTKFVGRDQEVELLLERWRRAKAGEGQVVLLSGEAGIGKSRITETLRERLRNEDYLRIQYQCSPHHVNSPLYPAIQQLTFAAGLRAEDSAEVKLDKLEALLDQSSAVDVAPLMSALLSIPADARYGPLDMTPQEQKQLTLRALIKLFEGLVAQRPVLFVFEDAHWIDPTTREQMDLFMERVGTLPALALVTHRPEFDAPWKGYAYCTVLALNRLGRDACTMLVDDLTAGRPLPDEVLDQIIAKTDGVPLFVEELTKTVLESGLLAQEADRYVLTGPLPPLAIPSTLQDSLMARLDRLEVIKEIAQIGAAIGREFPYALLAEVSPLRGQELERALTRLCESEIVFRRGMPPEATYVFKHALIQDTAYETLLRSRRQQIHAAIADALGSRFSDRVENEPEVLAHHYTQAGLSQQAAPQWLLAGRRAVARSANSEAIAHLCHGLDVLRELPAGREVSDLELDMQISLGSARIAARGYSAEETGEAYVRARELLDVVGDDPRHFAVLHGLSMFYINRAQFRQSSEVAKELLERAERQNDPLPTLVAHRVMAVTQNITGQFDSAREQAQRAVDLYDPERDKYSAHQFGHDQGVASYWHLSMALLFLGFVELSDKARNAASMQALELKNANTMLYDSLYWAFTSLVKSEWAKARDVARAMIDNASERSMALWVVFGRHHLGSALAALNEPEAALEEIYRGRTEANALNHYWLKPMTLRFEAQALVDLGRFDEALVCLDQALKLVEITEERWWEAEIYRARGEINLKSDGSRKDSETSFLKAVDVARGQKAKLFELRAAISVGHLWRDQGRNKDACDLVAPILHWFTESVDTPDLRDARALLNELA